MTNPNKFQGVKTKVTREADGTIIGTYHDTAVATRMPDGTVILRNGGYMTATTKTRINQFSQEFCAGRIRVYQKAREWFVEIRDSDGKLTVAFFDGMHIARSGN